MNQESHSEDARSVAKLKSLSKEFVLLADKGESTEKVEKAFKAEASAILNPVLQRLEQIYNVRFVEEGFEINDKWEFVGERKHNLGSSVGLHCKFEEYAMWEGRQRPNIWNGDKLSPDFEVHFLDNGAFNTVAIEVRDIAYRRHTRADLEDVSIALEKMIKKARPVRDERSPSD